MIFKYVISFYLKHFCVFTAELRVQQAMVGIHKIMCRHRSAIAPISFAQVESPFAGPFIMLPTLSHAGVNDVFILCVRTHKSLQQSGYNLSVSHSRSLMRVQAEGLLIITNDKNPLLRSFFCRATRIPTPRQKQDS